MASAGLRGMFPRGEEVGGGAIAGWELDGLCEGVDPRAVIVYLSMATLSIDDCLFVDMNRTSNTSVPPKEPPPLLYVFTSVPLCVSRRLYDIPASCCTGRTRLQLRMYHICTYHSPHYICTPTFITPEIIPLTINCSHYTRTTSVNRRNDISVWTCHICVGGISVFHICAPCRWLISIASSVLCIIPVYTTHREAAMSRFTFLGIWSIKW